VVRHARFDACRRTGRPRIFVTAHLGNWEIAAATARNLGVPLTVVYSPQPNPLTEWLVPARLALKVGCPLVPVRVERVPCTTPYHRTTGSPQTFRRGA
jgi:lauroyl/myristoyl acyltransferase